MADLKVIKTAAAYDAAILRLDTIFAARPDTPEGDELQVLLLLIQQYEDIHYSFPLPDPIEAIKLRMGEMHLKNKDLEPYLGHKSNVSKVLNRQRNLTVDMMRKLHKFLNIPAEVLLAG